MTDEQIARAIDEQKGIAERFRPTNYSSFELGLFRAGMREAARIVERASRSRNEGPGMYYARELIRAAAGEREG